MFQLINLYILCVCKTTLDTKRAAALRTVNEKDLIEALRPYVKVKELAEIVHKYVGEPFIST